MDKDNLDNEALLARVKTRTLHSSQNDSPQQLVLALFFMVVGLILVVTGFASVLLRLASMVHLPLRWLIQKLIQRIKIHRQINAELLQRLKHP